MKLLVYFVVSAFVVLSVGCSSTSTCNSVLLKGGSSAKEITLTNGMISISVIPDLGAKITSIKRVKGENIISRSNRPYVKRQYGMSYKDTEFDGIDEIFPTLTACKYPLSPWHAAKIPDHGELFSQAWDVLDEPGISLHVKGKQFPYVFKRQITLEGNKLIFNYSLKNNSNHDFYYFYMFHPLFKGKSGVKLSIPDNTKMTISSNKRNFLGKPGVIKQWADLRSETGLPFKESLFKLNSKRYWKIFSPRIEKGEISLDYKDSSVLMNWDSKFMPYYSVWCSEGILNGLNHIAPEPTTSTTESLNKAYQDGTAKVIKAGSTTKWRITITII